ncbi:AMP-binding protein, partial [candidate division KSB1 bacterium]|nr:AMP-binding protein [candidate division KSB1 bacterium]
MEGDKMQDSNLVAMFRETVAKHGSKGALYQKRDGVYQGFSYDEFDRRVRHFALGLASLGMQRGDRIALMSENRPEWVIADLGILSLGAINVPLYPTLTPKQIEYILNDSATRLIIVSQQELLDKVLQIFDDVPSLEKIIFMDPSQQSIDNTIALQNIYQKGKDFEKEQPDFYEQAVAKIETEDLCGIIYTSGTTGAPKGVMLSHGNLLSNVIAGLAVLHIDEQDIFLSFLPLCHSFERMAGQYAALAVGATIYYAESVEKVADNLAEVRPTVMTAVPRLFEKIYARVIENANSGSFLKKRIFWWAINTGDKYVKAQAAGNIPAMLQRKYNLAKKLVFSKLQQRIGGRLRFFASGGAPLSKEIAEFFYKTGILILEGYGLT